MLHKILKIGLPVIIIGIAISIAGYLKASKPVGAKDPDGTRLDSRGHSSKDRERKAAN